MEDTLLTKLGCFANYSRRFLFVELVLPPHGAEDMQTFKI